MPLAAGSRIGHYEIVARLGAGGMGEVWRARDPHLGRDVAIKALPDGYAHDAERLARFEREGRLLASLRHPNIAAIHAVVEHEGRRYLALEIVEGETLAARIARGPLPVDEAIEVGIQVAGALEAAHEAGVIHRDLKPGNVMLRGDGSVAVLDFGLARGPEGVGASDMSQSPTMTSPATAVGTILGTAAYLSPEQARGRVVDRRADVWAFGCVLYEMLTGKLAFAGETLTDLLAAILKAEPDWGALPAGTPARLRTLILRCLRKDPRERLRDIGDARLELMELRDGAPAADAGDVAGPMPVPRSRGLMLAPWLLVPLAIAAGWMLRQRTMPVGEAQRLTVLPAPTTTIDAEPAAFALSPDGRQIVFSARDSSGTSWLWLRDLASTTPRRLCEGGMLPFWSPDGRQIAFFHVARLYRHRIAEGSTEIVCEVTPGTRGGTWTPDGRLLFAPTSVGPLMIVPASGGEPVAASVLDTARHESLHRFPQMLPDGKHYLFAALPAPEGQAAICVGELGSTRHRLLFHVESAVRYMAPGWIVWSRNDRLIAQRFDARALRRIGEPIVLSDVPSGSTDISLLPYAQVSQQGDLAYLSYPSDDYDLVELDRNGGERRRVALPTGAFRYARVSPKGDQVTVESLSLGERTAIWLVELTRGGALNLTPEAKISANASWSNDGKRVAFFRRDSTGQVLVIRTLDGSRPDVTRRIESLFATVNDWTRDDRQMLLMTRSPATFTDLVVVPVDEAGAATPYLQTTRSETWGAFSPDDRWVVYRGTAKSAGTAYVQSFPKPGPLFKVSGDIEVGSSSTRECVWWPSTGDEILFSGLDGVTIWSTPVSTKDGFRAGTPRRLFRAPVGSGSIDPAPDGRSFYTVLPRGDAQPPTITWVRGWDRELGR